MTRGVLSLLGCAVCVKSIPNILGEIQSKNNFVRAKTCEYLAIMMDNYPEEVLERNLDGISKTLKKGLADADPQARTHSRTAMLSLQKSFPDEARRVFDSLDPSTRKQLNLAPSDSPILQPGIPKSAPPKKNTQMKSATPSKVQTRDLDEEMMEEEEEKKPNAGRNSLQNTKVRAQSAVKKTVSNLGTTIKGKDAPPGKEPKVQSAMKPTAGGKGDAVRNTGKSVDPFKEDHNKTATKPLRPSASATNMAAEMREWISKLDSTVAQLTDSELE